LKNVGYTDDGLDLTINNGPHVNPNGQQSLPYTIKTLDCEQYDHNLL
jgi:hypothetical protein